MKKRKELDGYFTIEATFLVTIILCILIFLMYLSFFIYNRALVTGLAYQVAMEGSRMYDKNQDDIEQATKEKADQIIKGRLIACSYESSVEVGITEVTVTYHIHVNMPFQALTSRMLTWFQADYTVKKSASRISGVTFIQTCQNVEQLKEAKEK